MKQKVSLGYQLVARLSRYHERALKRLAKEKKTSISDIIRRLIAVGDDVKSGW